MLQHRGWIVPVCVILVATAAAIVNGSHVNLYRTEAVLVVSSNEVAATSPENLATTYADLIGEDDGVIEAGARATRLPPTTVRSRIAADQVTGTSIIDVSFLDSQAERSAAGDAAVVNAVVGPHPASASIPVGALKLVSAPGTPFMQGSNVPEGPVPIGIVLGLFLGVAVLIAWDRHDARADDALILEDVIGVPVTALLADSRNGSLRAVQQRWRSLCEPSGPITIALVSATNDSGGAVRTAHARLTAGGTADGIVYREVAAPGGDDGALMAMNADLVVLVACRRVPVREIRDTVDALRKLGVEPRWALFADSVA